MSHSNPAPSALSFPSGLALVPGGLHYQIPFVGLNSDSTQNAYFQQQHSQPMGDPPPPRNPGPNSLGDGADLIHRMQAHRSLQPAQRSPNPQSAFLWADRIDKNQQLIEALRARLMECQQSDSSRSVVAFATSVDSTRLGSPSATSGSSTSSNLSGKQKQSQDSDSNSTTHATQSATASSPTSTSDTSSKVSNGSNCDEKGKKSKKNKKQKKMAEAKQKLVNLYPRKKKAEEQRSKDHMAITLEQLKPLFNYPLKQAAAKLGICTTAFKSVCRKFGLQRWPYKLLKQAGSNNECIAMMLRDGKDP